MKHKSNHNLIKLILIINNHIFEAPIKLNKTRQFGRETRIYIIILFIYIIFKSILSSCDYRERYVVISVAPPG